MKGFLDFIKDSHYFFSIRFQGKNFDIIQHIASLQLA
jgi:hypothetical protein